MATTAFKLTYASMFDPPEELHERFDRALTSMKRRPASCARAARHHRKRREPRRCDGDDERHGVRTDWRLLRQRRRDAVVLRPHPGRDVVRESLAGLVDRRVARVSVVRRLEGKRR